MIHSIYSAMYPTGQLPSLTALHRFNILPFRHAVSSAAPEPHYLQMHKHATNLAPFSGTGQSGNMGLSR